MNIPQYIEQLSTEVAGKVSIAIGSGGSLAQYITDWGNMFIMSGNGVLLVGGLYLMYHKIFNK